MTCAVIRKRADFVAANRGLRVARPGFVLLAHPNGGLGKRYGVTVTKKIGNAVMARAMVAEMHSSYLALRRACPMNIRKRVEGLEIADDVRNDIVRILGLWAEARARFGKGGPFVFGTFSAADVFYAPVVTRFVTYGIGVPGFAQVYMP